MQPNCRADKHSAEFFQEKFSWIKNTILEFSCIYCWEVSFYICGTIQSVSATQETSKFVSYASSFESRSSQAINIITIQLHKEKHFFFQPIQRMSLILYHIPLCLGVFWCMVCRWAYSKLHTGEANSKRLINRKSLCCRV